MPTFSTTIPARHEAVSRLRHDVRRWMHSDLIGAPPPTADDVGLVLTELAANVVDHTDAQWIEVEVVVKGQQVVVAVSSRSAATAIPAVDHWGATSGGERNHGLRLVRALCNTIEVNGDDRHSTVRCVLGVA